MRAAVALSLVLLAIVLGGCTRPPERGVAATRPPLELEPGRGPELAMGKVEPVFAAPGELLGKLAAPLVAPTKVVEPVSDEPLFQPEIEPNNRVEEGTPVRLPAVLQGQADPLPDSPDGDHDWFTFLVERESKAVLEVTLSGVPKVDLALEILHDSTVGRRRLFLLNNGGPGEGERLTNLQLANGRYHLHVHQMVAPKGKAEWDVLVPYRIDFAFKELSRTEEREPNDSPTAAVVLSLSEPMKGLVNRQDDVDCYSLDLSEQSVNSGLAVELLPPLGTTLSLELLSYSQAPMLAVEARDGARLVVPAVRVEPADSPYLFRVSHRGKKLPREPYTLQVTSKPLPLDQDSELEPSNVPEQAQKLRWGVEMAGSIFLESDEDWFRLEPDEQLLERAASADPPALNVVLEGVPGVNLGFELMRVEDGSVIGRFDDQGRGEREEAPNLAIPAKAVYLRVFSVKGANASDHYRLLVQPVDTTGKEREPNDTPESAESYAEAPARILGHLAPAGDRDCFGLPVLERPPRVVAPANCGLVLSAYTPALEIYWQKQLAAAEKETVEVRSGEGLVLCLEGEGERPPSASYTILLLDDLPLP